MKTGTLNLISVCYNQWTPSIKIPTYTYMLVLLWIAAFSETMVLSDMHGIWLLPDVERKKFHFRLPIPAALFYRHVCRFVWRLVRIEKYCPIHFKLTEICCRSHSIFYSYDAKLLNSMVRRTNIIYGGLRPDLRNVIFTNGDIDPWHALSILQNLNAFSPAILIKGT